VERVGIHDNFFQLGGHSLLAMRLVSSARREIDVELGIGTVFNNPTIALLAGYIAATDAAPALPAIIAAPRPEKIPLSFSQERLWFIDALEGSLQYHLPFVLRLKGELDTLVLEKALRTIVNRHEVLRTVIAEEDGMAYQRILDKDGWKLGSANDFVYRDEADLTDKIEKLIAAPFNLAADYMLRGDLIRVGEAEHVLLGTMHHIISDGWSIPILVNELTELYNAFTAGRNYQLPELPVQYADYTIWQREYLSGDVLNNKMAYWQQQLAGLQVLNLPTDHTRTPLRSSKGAAAGFRLDKELTASLERMSLDNGATLYMTLLSAFNILLHKYTGQDDICVGSPVAGRQMQEVEGLIGFFINTLVLRNRISPGMSFREFLLQVRKTTLEAYANQEVPFEKVVEAVVKERDMSRSPLFDIMFVLQNNAQADSLENGLAGLSVSFEGNQDNTSKFDMSVTLRENPAGISGEINYNSDLYDRETVQRMLTHYERLLQAVVADQNQPLEELQMITDSERRQLLFEFNDTAADYPKDKTIVDLFYQQADKTPDSIAVVFGDEELTYRQLDERSNQLGHFLRSKGVREDSLVVICVERSLEMIIGILGILKAGAAYVPIDPDYPQDRIAYMIQDTDAKIALTAGAVLLPDEDGLLVININTEKHLIDTQHIQKVKTKLLPSNLAYVIYTSGSTGWPKGVMIEHSGFVNMTLSQVLLFKLNEDKIVLQFASFSFDASCSEIFTTLISGGRLIIPTKETLLSVDLITTLIEKFKIDILTIPPSYQLQIKGSLNNIKTIISAGENLNRNLTKEFQSAGINVVNAYGPTEYTVCATFAPNPILNDAILIGRPIANTQIYILGPDQGLVPVGVTGEICISGAGLA
ncbi:condensation domain-containing protein, partial [Mucilaginibacter sp. RCC_168]|uniref:non-ribosomal peptide synthetase n=1 Tax=Mucilaginibacter sp. RCC_168 TaxID=3239221 RepID=UPI00352552A9